MNVSIESRADKFLGSVNRQISGAEYKLPYGEPEAAFAVVSLVAAHYWNDPNNQGFVDRAFEAAAYLEGSSVRKLALDPRMTHIIDKTKYGPRTRDESLKIVASLGAALVDGSETPVDDEVEIQESIKRELFGNSRDLRDVVLDLVESQRISRQLAEGLLIVAGEVDTSELNPDSLRRVDRLTRHVLREKIASSFGQGDFAITQALVGNSRDGIAEAPMDAIIEENRQKMGDYKKGEAYVREHLAREIAMLFAPRF